MSVIPAKAGISLNEGALLSSGAPAVAEVTVTGAAVEPRP
jgi:hypothetical protein